MYPAALACVAITVVAASVGAGVDSDSTALRREAFDLAYNLDRDPALDLLQRAVAGDETDPAVHRAIAALTWLEILFQRGAVTVDHYLGPLSRPQVDVARPPADLDARFREHIDRAIALAERRVDADTSDPSAHYELGAAIGLRASYVATIDGKVLAAVRAARRAFDAHERVLELDPARKDAGLIVGMYRYVVGSMALPLRLMAYLAGFGGGKERGIRMVEEAAAYRSETQAEARFALVLLYNREGRYRDALQILEILEREYPRNRLVLLERGSTALRAGRSAQAETVLTTGLARLAEERRALAPAEPAVWRYKRGAARVALGRPADAIADLRMALSQAPPDWIAGRIHLELGKSADLGGRRKEARTEYQAALAACERGRDAWCSTEARRFLRSAYQGGPPPVTPGGAAAGGR